MTESNSADVINLQAAQTALHRHFLGWQCRIRQLSIRQAGGRPTAGMRPRVFLESDREASALAQITVLLIKREPQEMTAQFRHMVRKTFDPADRYDSALKFLAAAYYQRAEEFSDRMTALFGVDSDVARRLQDTGRCRLEFEQYQQHYRIPCAVRRLGRQHAAYQATYWHNSLFNAQLPGDVQILEFQPDWAKAEANPPVPG
jgi:hypothetical protein